jgi:hypothetical protein
MTNTRTDPRGREAFCAAGLKIPRPTIPGATFITAGNPQFNIVPPGQTGVAPTQ